MKKEDYFKIFSCLKSCSHALLVVVMLLGTVQLYAQSDTRVTINVTNQPVREVLTLLKKQTSCKFVYEETLISPTKKVSLSFNATTLKIVVEEMCKQLNISVEFDRDIVLLLPAKSTSKQQNEKAKQFTIKGRVLTKAGKPIAGATVIILGTTRGVITDDRGDFALSVAGGMELEFSCTGMITKKLIVDPNSLQIAVEMLDDVMAVDEVVVTGIFNKAKESYTGSATKIQKEQLESFKGQNLIHTLRNIDPAINLVANNLSGSDPNRLPDMTIRGSSSLPTSVKEFNEGQKFNLNTPLVIMDGFEVSLRKLMDYSDEEIESITILKDASATAIYGSRGANGVIVIVSKQPTPGKLRISVKAGLDFELPDLSSYDLLGSAEKLKMEWDNGFYKSENPTNDITLKQRYNENFRNIVEGVDTHWLSQPLRSGVSQKYNINLNGGSDEFRWGVNTSYINLAGVMKGSDRSTFNGEIILAYHFKNVIFKNQTNIGFNKADNSIYGGFGQYANMNPYWRIRTPEGRLIEEYRAGFGDGSTSTTKISNPLYNSTLTSFDNNSYISIINNFSIEWKIANDLTVRGQLGISNQTNESNIFLSPEHTDFKKPPYDSADGLLRRGKYDYGSGKDFNYDANITLNYVKSINQHQIYAGIDYSISQRKGHFYDFSAEGYTNEQLNSVGSAMSYAKNSSPRESETFTRRIGATANVNYTYDNRYYADLSVRMDGSSQFGSKNRFAPFWSAGLGWNLHRENFLKESKVINNLRLKASYGQTGSQQFSAYQALSTYAYYMNSRYVNWGGAYLKSHGNENLKWQITDQFNVGTEIGAFNNRLTASVDVYVKKTSNLLSELDVPYATGFGSFIDNIGEVKNSGFEAALGGYLIRNIKRDFIWTVNAKLAYNKNEITKVSEAIKTQNELYLKLSENPENDVDINNLFYEGRSQNSLYAVRSQGIDPSTGQEIFINRYGMVTDKWSPADKVYLGVNEPIFRGNFSTMLRYGPVSLNLSFGYHWGGLTYNETLISRVETTRSTIGTRNSDRRVLTDRWSEVGQQARFRKIAALGESEVATRPTSRFVMKDNVFELQSASLQYRFENDWLKNKCGVSSATLSANASDIFYMSTVKRERGINYPFARRVGLSATLVF